MNTTRYRSDTTNSFFGNFLYEEVLPEEHFLVRLRKEVPWRKFTRKMILAYKGQGEYGPPPYAPEKLLRMLLVPYLFNISEREAEQVVRFNLLAKYFVGLGVDELPPDHSTLTVFKERLSNYGGEKIWEGLFSQIIGYAKRRGIRFGRLQVIDSTYTTAEVNREKDQQRQRRGKPPRDPEASFKTKGTKEERTKEGQKVKVKDRVYGYKAHTSWNYGSELITAVKVTTAKEDDGKQFQRLVKKDKGNGIAQRGHIYTADKAYDDGEHHEFLKVEGLVSAIKLKETRVRKTNPHRELWERMERSGLYQKAAQKRKAIEKKFGEEKERHGLGRCRYLGLGKYAIQAYLTAFVVNLKRIMKLTGEVSLAYQPGDLSG